MTSINPIMAELPLVERHGHFAGVLLNQNSILQQLDTLIKHRDDALADSPHEPADETSDWLAANFLFNIGCQNRTLECKLYPRLMSYSAAGHRQIR